MAYLFETELVYANAFHPLGRNGSWLSHDEIGRFCLIVGEELIEAAGEEGSGESPFVMFNLDAPLGDGMAKRFAEVSGHVVWVGSAISDDELDGANLCLGDDAVARRALAVARQRFADEIGLGRRPSLAYILINQKAPREDAS